MTRNTLAIHACLLAVLAMSACAGLAAAADPWEQLARAAADSDAGSARKTLEALLLEQPSFAAGHFNLGTLEMESDPDAAATHLEMACASTQIELVADALHNLALVRWKQGRLEDAVDAAARASKLRGTDASEQKLLSELRRVLIVRADQARRTAEEEAKKLHLAITSLPDAHAQEPYDTRLAAAGGRAPYRFSLGAAPTAAGIPAGGPPAPGPAAAGGPPAAPAPTPLPPGIDLEGDGRLHGTATRPGRYDIPLVLSDGAGSTISATVTLTVVPAPAITTSHLPEAVLGSRYQATVTSDGLERPQWTVSGLPAGLSASSLPGASIEITGIAHQAGSVTIHVAAADHQRHAERDLDLAVTDLFAAEPSILPPATVWAPYQQTLNVLGPPQSYAWNAPAQAGLHIAADGAVSGSPDKAGDQVLTATIQAEDGRQRAVTLNLHVNPPPVIEESAPIGLTRGQAVDRPVRISGGTPPYHWSIADGVLPTGVRLDADGTVRGAPTQIGKSDITIAVADHWQATTQQKVTIEVAAADPNKDPDTHDQAKNDHQPDDQKSHGQKQGDTKSDEQKQENQGTNGQKQDSAQQGQQGQQSQDHNQQNTQSQQGQQGDQNPQRGSDHQASQRNGAHDAPTGDAQHPQTDHSAGQQHGQPEAGADNQNRGGGAKSGAAQDAARQAQAINQAAVDRWLDQLPKENRSVLRYQLLEGGDAQPQYKGKTW